ncbi:MAG: 16S rRNA (guanine(527)-N(7))-methyltransferase RsmG [Anaerolineae bacterium]|jgi:16S rRNA (guanine527-N7)-methyltransferase
MKQLASGARALGLHLDGGQVDAFEAYYRELVAWNQKFNLTAITDYEGVQIRHFLDSLSLLVAADVREIATRPGARAIDVGSGAGFPGIPLKLVCPGLHLTLLEATGKKVTFLEHIVAHLGLAGVTAIKGRAEALAHDPAHRESYDLVTARAVADLAVLAEYCLPFCRPAGRVVAQKGAAGEAEAGAAAAAIETVGGALRDVVPVVLPGLPADRTLIVLEKVGPTPPAYPRRPGMPAKRPLA